MRGVPQFVIPAKAGIQPGFRLALCLAGMTTVSCRPSACAGQLGFKTRSQLQVVERALRRAFIQRARGTAVPRAAPPLCPEAVKKLNGRDALLRVRDGKPNTDAEHRVPTGLGLYAQANFFTAPLAPCN